MAVHSHKGFELLRIIAMFFIVCHHYLVHGGILQQQVLTGNFILAWGLDAFAYVGVNCFVLLTGYFMSMQDTYANMNRIWKKLGKLWIIVLFYSIGGVIVGLFAGEHIGLKMVVQTLLPIRFNEWWFLSSYAGLLVLSPFLNQWIQGFSKCAYVKFLMVLIGIFSLYSCVGDTFHANGGSSLVWFIVLYSIGGYLRKYDISFPTAKLFMAYLGVSLLIWLCKISIDYAFYWKLGHLYKNALYPYASVYAYNSLTLLASSVALFLMFKNTRIHNSYISRLISYVSPLTLGIYLIHEHPLIRDWLWHTVIQTQSVYDSPWFIICFAGSSILVFVGAAWIEKGRQCLFIYVGNHLPDSVYQSFSVLREKAACFTRLMINRAMKYGK